MANGLDPGCMTADERLAEAAAILAVGLERLRNRGFDEKRPDSSLLAENSLDFSAQQSVHPTVSMDGEHRHAR